MPVVFSATRSSAYWCQMASDHSSSSSMPTTASNGPPAMLQGVLGVWGVLRPRWASALVMASGLLVFPAPRLLPSSILPPRPTWDGEGCGSSEWTRRRSWSLAAMIMVSEQVLWLNSSRSRVRKEIMRGNHTAQLSQTSRTQMAGKRCL